MKNLTVIVWDRSKWFESPPPNPHMYYFLKEDETIMWDDIDDLPSGFLRIPSTALYEFGGTYDESLKALEKAGCTHVLLTDNIA